LSPARRAAIGRGHRGRAFRRRKGREGRRHRPYRNEWSTRCRRRSAPGRGGEATYGAGRLSRRRRPTLEHAIGVTVQKYGGLTTLVNQPPRPPTSSAPDAGDRATSARSPTTPGTSIMTVAPEADRVVHAATRSPHLHARRPVPAIVNISSAAGDGEGVPGIDAYNPRPRGALNALTRSPPRSSLAGNGVRVNTIVLRDGCSPATGAFKMMDHPVDRPPRPEPCISRRLGLPEDIGERRAVPRRPTKRPSSPE